MNSHEVWRKLRREHNSVEQLKELMQPSLDELETISKSLGKNGLKALKDKKAPQDKRDQAGIFSKTEYTEDENTYISLEDVIKVYNGAIENRESLDLILLDPAGFKGFIDREASRDDEKRYQPIHKSITLFEPYDQFFTGLKRLRQQMGRNEITAGEALEQGKVLEQKAGLKGVIIGDGGGDVTNANTLVDQMENDIDSLGHSPDYSGCYDSGDHSLARGDIQSEIDKFFIPIKNGLILKAIPPVDVDFENAVNAIIRNLPSAVLGKEPESHRKSERPTITTARRELAYMAAQSSDLRNAVEEFLRASEAELRDEGHIVLKHQEPKDALKVIGPGGS